MNRPNSPMRRGSSRAHGAIMDRAETRVRDERPLFYPLRAFFMSSMLDIYRQSCYSIRVKQALLLIEGVLLHEESARRTAQAARHPSGGFGAGAGRVAADGHFAGKGESTTRLWRWPSSSRAISACPSKRSSTTATNPPTRNCSSNEPRVLFRSGHWALTSRRNV